MQPATGKFRPGEIFARIRKRTFKENLRRFLNLKGDPTQIAFSFAIGIFLGLIIPMGLQTVVAVPIAIALECNLVVAWTATLITNPLTIVPIYMFAIKIGSVFTSNAGGLDKISELIKNPSFASVSVISKFALTDLVIGIFILAVTTSLISFFIVRYSLIFYRNKKGNGHLS